MEAGISMTGVKLAAHSSILGRLFHADGFRSAKVPDVFVIMFGGSGITEAEYSMRAASAVPFFDTALASLERERPFAFAFVANCLAAW
jgi:hypothetical protein